MLRRDGGTPVELRLVLCRTHRDERRRAHELACGTAADLLGADARGLVLDHDTAGRPRLRGRQSSAAPVQVSISHAPRVAAVAVSTATVGVDVEVIRPLPALALARRWFPLEEQRWLSRRPHDEQVPAFLTLWTLKEAIGKARGLGLAGGAGLRVPVPRRRLADGAPLVLSPVPGRPGLLVGSALRADLVIALACTAGSVSVCFSERRDAPDRCAVMTSERSTGGLECG